MIDNKQAISKGWIQTFTGKRMYPLDPKPEDICIEDIAHALSNICRFTGHTKKFYSVGEHSINCLDLFVQIKEDEKKDSLAKER